VRKCCLFETRRLLSVFLNDDQLILALGLLKVTDGRFAVNGMTQRSLQLDFRVQHYLQNAS
jgi:hypothetical protein